MPYRELMMRDHPEEIDQECCGGVCGCPSDYYDIPYECPFVGQKGKPLEEACTECWNREYPDMAQDNKHTTIADRIRAMVSTDEGIAKILMALDISLAEDGKEFTTLYCDGKNNCIDGDGEITCTDEMRTACIMRWLSQPAEED